MAWNEPDKNGGNKDRDPWSQQDQGPPDLDEALNKLKAQIFGIFGGSGGGRPSGSGGDMPKGLISLVIVVLAAVWG